jgi:hypothetical protein
MTSAPSPDTEVHAVSKLCSNCHKEVDHTHTSFDCTKCNKHCNTLMRAIESEKFYAFLAEDKCLTGCEECGYGKGEKHKACALHYDHLNKQEKNFIISQICGGNITFKTMVKKYKVERPKCRVLCANCHSLHSKEQLQEDKEQTLTEAIQYFANFQHRELRPRIKSRLYELINIPEQRPQQLEFKV